MAGLGYEAINHIYQHPLSDLLARGLIKSGFHPDPSSNQNTALALEWHNSDKQISIEARPLNQHTTKGKAVVIKFCQVIFDVVVGCGFFAGKTPAVARRYSPSSPSLTLVGRAYKYADAHVLSLPQLLIKDENIPSAFQIKPSCSKPVEPGVR